MSNRPGHRNLQEARRQPQLVQQRPLEAAATVVVPARLAPPALSQKVPVVAVAALLPECPNSPAVYSVFFVWPQPPCNPSKLTQPRLGNLQSLIALALQQ